MQNHELQAALAIAERYVATWNETDPGRRRVAIESLWVPEGIHATPTMYACGFDAIDARISDAHRRFVTEGRYRFMLHTGVDTHHSTVRFAWEMVPASGGANAGMGFDFLILDDLRIKADFQYPYPLPEADG